MRQTQKTPLQAAIETACFLRCRFNDHGLNVVNRVGEAPEFGIYNNNRAPITTAMLDAAQIHLVKEGFDAPVQSLGSGIRSVLWNNAGLQVLKK